MAFAWTNTPAFSIPSLPFYRADEAHNINREEFCIMKDDKICKSIFKTGETVTTRKDITQAFIAMIKQLERSKTVLSGVR